MAAGIVDLYCLPPAASYQHIIAFVAQLVRFALGLK
jgi:hypothetical protein